MQLAQLGFIRFLFYFILYSIGFWSFGLITIINCCCFVFLKILARASKKPPVENVWVNVDILMTHDVWGPGAIGIFKKEFGKDAKVLDFFY